MYDYDDFTLTIENDGAVFVHEPGRRKRKLGLVSSRKVTSFLRELDLELVGLWAYLDAGLRDMGLRKDITLFASRASGRSTIRLDEFSVVAAFTLDRKFEKKRWGGDDFGEEFVAHLEREIPLKSTRQTHHQELAGRWLFAVTVESEDEADAFLEIIAEMIKRPAFRSALR